MTDARIDGIDLSTHRARVGDVRVRLCAPALQVMSVAVSAGGVRVRVSDVPAWAWKTLWAGTSLIALWAALRDRKEATQ